MTMLVPGTQGAVDSNSTISRSARIDVGCAENAAPMANAAAAVMIIFRLFMVIPFASDPARGVHALGVRRRDARRVHALGVRRRDARRVHALGIRRRDARRVHALGIRRRDARRVHALGVRKRKCGTRYSAAKRNTY
jgi:hypothetical protein